MGRVSPGLWFLNPTGSRKSTGTGKLEQPYTGARPTEPARAPNKEWIRL